MAPSLFRMQITVAERKILLLAGRTVGLMQAREDPTATAAFSRERLGNEAPRSNRLRAANPPPDPSFRFPFHIEKCLLDATNGSNERRGWDSNPRAPCDANSFRDCPVQPLRHPSGNI